MCRMAIFLGVTLIAPPLRAQASSEQLARCAAITVASLRLECYDALSRPKADTSKAPAIELPAGARLIDKWIVSVDTDPITDRKGITFMLQAEGATRIDTPTLIIRCRQGELDAFISPDEYLGSDNDRITIRFGADTPTQERWTESANHSALFVPGNRAKVEEFVRKLARYDRLAAQVRPYNKAPMSMVFELAGIERVNDELWSICSGR